MWVGIRDAYAVKVLTLNSAKREGVTRGNRFTRGSRCAMGQKTKFQVARPDPILLLMGPGAWNHDIRLYS